MSVYRQHQYAESATIADELESFLHVLVFYCLLLMKSNMLYHSRFTQYYFRHRTWDLTAEQLVAEEGKRTSVMYCGKLTQTGIERIAFHFHSLDHSVKWEHAVNKLLAALFKTFHARYVVWRWERETKKCVAHREPAPERPPQHVFDTVASLSEHVGVRSLFWRMFRDDSLCWPAQDIVRREDTKSHTPDMEELSAAEFAEYPPPEDARPAKRRKIAEPDEAEADEGERRMTRSRTAAQAVSATRVTRSKAQQTKGACPSAGGSRGRGAAGRPRRR